MTWRSSARRRSLAMTAFCEMSDFLSEGQGVGHREGDFDFRRYLSQLIPCVTSVHYCHIFSYPVSAIR